MTEEPTHACREVSYYLPQIVKPQVHKDRYMNYELAISARSVVTTGGPPSRKTDSGNVEGHNL